MMDLEQDAMLTATGQMSMEEAREKWADRWSEFVQSMSRWKSLHVLLMMVRINAQQQRLAEHIKDLSKRERAFEVLGKAYQSEMKSIDLICYKIRNLSRLKSDVEEHNKTLHTIESVKNGEIAAPPSMTYESTIYAAKAAASLAAEYEAAGGDKRLYELSKKYSEKLKKATGNLEWTHKNIETTENDIQAAKIKQKELQDEYDIAKPYAMGLLVADIFKSLAMAIEGEIY